MRVKLYWNLHKDCFSVMDASTGRVAFHAATVALRDVTFKVQAGGLARAKAERKRNVHAFAIGELVEAVRVGGERVSYNPFRADTFTLGDGRAIHAAAAVYGETLPNGKPALWAV